MFRFSKLFCSSKNKNREHKFCFYFFNIALLFVLITSITGCSEDDSNPVKPINVPEVDVENKVLLLINEYRISKGLSELSADTVIRQQCRLHSNNMASHFRELGHEGLESERIPAIEKVISWAAFGENVAMNRGYDDPAQKAVTDWLNSQSHLHNIEGDYNLTGIGVIKSSDGSYYLTQIFIKTK